MHDLESEEDFCCVINDIGRINPLEPQNDATKRPNEICFYTKKTYSRKSLELEVKNTWALISSLINCEVPNGEANSVLISTKCPERGLDELSRVSDLKPYDKATFDEEDK